MSTPSTHPTNVSYLVVGLVFLGIAGSWALRAAGIVDTSEVGWLLPLTLVVAGAIGLVAFAARHLTRDREHDDRLAGHTLEDDSAYDPYEIDHTEGDPR